MATPRRYSVSKMRFSATIDALDQSHSKIEAITLRQKERLSQESVNPLATASPGESPAGVRELGVEGRIGRARSGPFCVVVLLPGGQVAIHLLAMPKVVGDRAVHLPGVSTGKDCATVSGEWPSSKA
jgi:hypothetical protein